MGGVYEKSALRIRPEKDRRNTMIIHPDPLWVRDTYQAESMVGTP
jgi:hypothetical protein